MHTLPAIVNPHRTHTYRHTRALFHAPIHTHAPHIHATLPQAQPGPPPEAELEEARLLALAEALSAPTESLVRRAPPRPRRNALPPWLRPRTTQLPLLNATAVAAAVSCVGGRGHDVCGHSGVAPPWCGYSLASCVWPIAETQFSLFVLWVGVWTLSDVVTAGAAGIRISPSRRTRLRSHQHRHCVATVSAVARSHKDQRCVQPPRTAGAAQRSFMITTPSNSHPVVAVTYLHLAPPRTLCDTVATVPGEGSLHLHAPA